MVFRLNINLVLRRSIKLYPNVDAPYLNSLDTNSSRTLLQFRLGSPVRIFRLEMSEPVCETVTRVSNPVKGR